MNIKPKTLARTKTTKALNLETNIQRNAIIIRPHHLGVVGVSGSAIEGDSDGDNYERFEWLFVGLDEIRFEPVDRFQSIRYLSLTNERILVEVHDVWSPAKIFSPESANWYPPDPSTSLRQGERKKQPNVQRGRTAVILRFSSSFLIRRDAPPLRARPRATHRCGGCGGRLPRLFSG